METEEILRVVRESVEGVDLESWAHILEEHNDTLSAFSYFLVTSLALSGERMGAVLTAVAASLETKCMVSCIFLRGFEAGVAYGKLNRLMPDWDEGDEATEFLGKGGE